MGFIGAIRAVDFVSVCVLGGVFRGGYGWALL